MSSTTCRTDNCAHLSESTSGFEVLQLGIDKATTIQEALGKFVSVQAPEGARCGTCGKESLLTRQRISTPPEVLIIQLIRQVWVKPTAAQRAKGAQGKARKIEKLVEFPEELDLRPYVVSDAEVCRLIAVRLDLTKP